MADEDIVRPTVPADPPPPVERSSNTASLRPLSPAFELRLLGNEPEVGGSSRPVSHKSRPISWSSTSSPLFTPAESEAGDETRSPSPEPWDFGPTSPENSAQQAAHLPDQLAKVHLSSAINTALQPVQESDSTWGAYEARYLELSKAWYEDRQEECLEGCHLLLLEPAMPDILRIEVLQMAATLLEFDPAETYLWEAEEMLTKEDGKILGVKIVIEDNEELLK